MTNSTISDNLELNSKGELEEKRAFTVVWMNEGETTIKCRPSWLQERLRAQPPERFLFIAAEGGETAINLDNVMVIRPYVELGF